MDQQIKDEEIIRRTLTGDVNHFSLLITRYKRVVFNLVLRMVGNRTDAEDLTQETFIRAYQALQSFDLTRPFKPWVLKIACNLALNKLKGMKSISLDEWPEVDAQLPEMADKGLSPEKFVESRELQRRLRDEILRLPVRYRLVFTLRYLEDHSLEEISEIADVPINTVKVHLFRARELLKDRLKKIYRKFET